MAYCAPKGIPLTVFLAWPQADQDAALAWQAHESARCAGCGTHPDDWDGDPRAWVAEPHRCQGCRAAEEAHANLEKIKDRGRGVRVRLRRREAVRRG